MTGLKPQTMRQAAAFLVGERAFRMFVGFFVHTWMARSLSTEDFGFISFTVKSVSVYFAFGLFGADEVIIKHLVSSSTEEKKSVLQTTLRMRLGLGLLGWLLLSVITGVVSEFFSAVWYTVSLFGLIIPLQAFTVYELPFMAQMTMMPVFWARNTSYLAGAAFKFAALYSRCSSGAFVGLYAIEEFLWKFIIFVKAIAQGFGGGSWNKQLARTLWGSGVLAFMASFIILFDQRIPFLFLQAGKHEATLGAYAVVVSLIDMILLLPISLASAVFPKVARSYETSDGNYEHERQKMSNYLVWAGICFAVPAYILAPYILEFLYQGKYPHATGLFRGMAMISVWSFFNIGRFKWFALEEGLKEWLALTVLSLLLQTVALYLLFPHLGTISIVVSMATGQFGASLCLIGRQKVRTSLKIFINSFFWKR